MSRTQKYRFNNRRHGLQIRASGKKFENDKKNISNEIQELKDSYIKMQQEYNWNPN
jgi:predicted RNA-binding protein with EMAP domain